MPWGGSASAFVYSTMTRYYRRGVVVVGENVADAAERPTYEQTNSLTFLGSPDSRTKTDSSHD
eukprot:scaffold746_cov123-Cylindrotheca_fusiformis.AAC.29